MKREMISDRLRAKCPCFRNPPFSDFVRWPDGDHAGAELWVNSRYTVNKRSAMLLLLGEETACVYLGISNLDQSARRDWRDFQRIKDELAGREWTGVELYPPHDEVIDPSNYFLIWCVPPGVIQSPLEKQRLVVGPAGAVAPQRALPEGMKPEHIRKVANA